MKKEQVTYYLIWGRLVGKEDCGSYFIYRNGRWEPDDRSMIMDRLMGYDPSEPPDSPYGIGNSDIMDEIEEITYDEAMKQIGGKA